MVQTQDIVLPVRDEVCCVGRALHKVSTIFVCRGVPQSHAGRARLIHEGNIAPRFASVLAPPVSPGPRPCYLQLRDDRNSTA